MKKRLTYKPRAFRFHVQSPLRYRENGQTDWCEGTVINMSRTGVLFRAAHEVEPKTMLELQIRFPTEDPPANVMCWGPAVRMELPQPPDSQPAIAAAISRYRFTHE